MFFSLRGFVNRLTGPIRTFFSPITRYLSIPTRFIGAAGRLLGLSLPARVGLILFVFLVVLVVATPFALASLDRSAALDEFKQPRWLIVLTVMVVLTPIVAYQTVKVFLEGVDSEYPEIDRAWDAGLTALVKSGLDLTKLPVFLVLGPRSPAQIDNIVDACGLQLLVDRVPEGRAPLRWYASEQAVMLACIETGCLSLTNASLRTSTPALDAGPTDEVDLGGTLKVGLSEATDAVHDPSPLESEFAEQSGVFGTLVAGLKDTLRPGTSVLAKDVFAGSRLSNADTELETRRLMHVANLLRRAPALLCRQWDPRVDPLGDDSQGHAARDQGVARGPESRLGVVYGDYAIELPDHRVCDRYGIGNRFFGTCSAGRQSTLPTPIRPKF